MDKKPEINILAISKDDKDAKAILIFTVDSNLQVETKFTGKSSPAMERLLLKAMMEMAHELIDNDLKYRFNVQEKPKG